MNIKNAQQLREFIKSNQVEDGTRVLKTINKDVYATLKKIIEYQDKLERELRQAGEVKASIAYSAFLILFIGIISFSIGWVYKKPIHLLISKYEFFAPLFVSYACLAIVNIFDIFKRYDWLDYLFDLKDKTFDEDIKAIGEEEAKAYQKESIDDTPDEEEDDDDDEDTPNKEQDKGEESDEFEEDEDDEEEDILDEEQDSGEEICERINEAYTKPKEKDTAEWLYLSEICNRLGDENIDRRHISKALKGYGFQSKRTTKGVMFLMSTKKN